MQLRVLGLGLDMNRNPTQMKRDGALESYCNGLGVAVQSNTSKLERGVELGS